MTYLFDKVASATDCRSTGHFVLPKRKVEVRICSIHELCARYVRMKKSARCVCMKKSCLELFMVVLIGAFSTNSQATRCLDETSRQQREGVELRILLLAQQGQSDLLFQEILSICSIREFVRW